MELKTIASKVEYIGWKPAAVEMRDEVPQLVFELERWRRTSWRWENVNGTKLWRTLAALHHKNDQAVLDFMVEWGPILRQWQKGENRVRTNERRVTIPDAPMPEIRAALRWFNRVAKVLVETTLKNDRDAFKEWVINNILGDGLSDLLMPCRIYGVRSQALAAALVQPPVEPLSWPKPRLDIWTDLPWHVWIVFPDPWDFTMTRGSLLLKLQDSHDEWRNWLLHEADDTAWRAAALNSVLLNLQPWISAAELVLPLPQITRKRGDMSHSLHFRAWSLMEACALQFYLDELADFGRKRCEADDCANPVEGARSKFCSARCQNRQRQREWYRNPENRQKKLRRQRQIAKGVDR